MGNCRFVENRCLRINSNISSLNKDKDSLVFKIKTWPKKSPLNLKDMENCTQRTITASLTEGESIQINLKSQYQKFSQRMNQIMFNLHCQIKKTNKRYTISFPLQEQRDYLWKYAPVFTEIKEGDIIRIGATKYQLIKFVQAKQNIPIFKDKSQVVSYCSHTSDQCRVCLDSNTSSSNSLVSACACVSGGRLIHMKCLSDLLFHQNTIMEANLRIHTKKSICQLCKKIFTSTWNYKQMSQLLISKFGQRMQAPFCLLHTTTQQTEYLFMSFSKNNCLVFGRSNKADICQKKDKCISRINSKIKYSEDKIMIKDADSTSGTFIKVNSQIMLDVDNKQVEIRYRNMLVKATYQPFQQAVIN